MRAAEGAASAGAQGTARLASLRGDSAEAAGDFGGAVSAFLDAASAWEVAGEAAEAAACAKRALALWPQFEDSKRLVLEPARRRGADADAARPLRRLPKAAPREAEPPAPPAEVRSGDVLPSMYLEMHAEALRLAGRAREGSEKYAEALAAVEREVERRRAGQEWGEAFLAARALLRIAPRAGGEERLRSVRPAFIAMAREAAREALTADAFARGRDELPLAAMDEALAQAHAHGDGELTAIVADERREGLERTAELLDALTHESTAAEALLASEVTWTFLDSRPDLKRALVADPRLATTLAGPFAGLAGAAAQHPARAELQDFAERLAALVERARARSAQVKAQLADEGPQRAPGTARYRKGS